MVENHRVVRYISYDNTIKFPSKIGSFVIRDFAAAIAYFKRRRPGDLLTLDFMAVEKPYTNGMVPIITTIATIRQQGHRCRVYLPNNANVRKLFLLNNWAHYLDPNTFKLSDSVHDKHLVTKQFTNYQELPVIINEFMDVVLRTMRIPRDILSALEWSVNEICDNVLNHSESPVGGFIQVITFTKQNQISFTVADSGRGILNTLKEGIPSLRTDVQAIGEAIKAGVTRNKEFGQGNGLAGSLRITTMTGGSLDITSGTGRFISAENSKHDEGDRFQNYLGTSVNGQIMTNKKFSIGDALEFNGQKYTPLNTIDLNYEMNDQDCLYIAMKNETTGFGTRPAGKQMRTKTANFIESKPNYPIYVDWSGVPVISSSFADEYMGKLFLELGPINFSSKIRNKNMEPLVHGLLDKAISQRLTQEKD